MKNNFRSAASLYSFSQYLAQGLGIATQVALLALLDLKEFGMFAVILVAAEIFVALLYVEYSTVLIYHGTQAVYKTACLKLAFYNLLIITIGGVFILASAYAFFGTLKHDYALILIIIISRCCLGFANIIAVTTEFNYDVLSISVLRLVSKFVACALAITAAYLNFGIYSLLINEVAYYLLCTFLIFAFFGTGLSEINATGSLANRRSLEILSYGYRQAVFKISSSITLKAPIIFANFLGLGGSAVGLIDRIIYFCTIPNSLLTPFFSKLYFIKLIRNRDQLESDQSHHRLTKFAFIGVLAISILALFSPSVFLTLDVGVAELTSQLVSASSFFILGLVMTNILSQHEMSEGRLMRLSVLSLSCTLIWIFVLFLYHRFFGTPEIWLIVLCYGAGYCVQSASLAYLRREKAA